MIEERAEIGQEAVNEYACLLGVWKKFVATDPVHSGLDAVADRYTLNLLVGLLS